MDFNDDGYLDLIVGERDGYVNFFRRKPDGTLTEEPDISANGSAIDVGRNSAPNVIDWNEDGLLDILIGTDTTKKVLVFLNSGTATSYRYTTPTEVLCGNASIAYARCIPHVVDLNLNGKKDIVIGEDLGYIYFLENVGTNASPRFNTSVILKSDGSNIKWGAGLTDVALWVGDYDDNGTPDILMGNYADSVYMYLNNTPTDINNQSHKMVSQNFTKNIVTRGTFSVKLTLKKEQNITIKMFSSDGKLIKTNNSGVLSVGEHSVGMNMNTLPMGVYFIHYQVNNQNLIYRVVFVK